jgi:uncharacterized membrane protein YeiH
MDDTISQALGNLEGILNVGGTIAFAISGALAAGRARMDWAGVVVLGIAAAVGGGTTRDLLLGELPVFWVDQTWFVIVAAVTALAVIPVSRTRVLKILNRYDLVNIADAAGLSLFVITGVGIALDAGANDFVAMLMGVISGTGGGIIRDLLANKVPEVLHKGEVYATAALAGAAIYVGLLHLSIDPRLTVWLPIGLIFALRMLAIFRGWEIPKFEPKRARETDE